MINFLKKYLVLILCGTLVVAALAAGVWHLVKPSTDDPSEETGGFENDLNVDMGIGIPGEENASNDTPSGGSSSDNVTVITPEDQSGIVNIPGGDSSGSVTPVTPEDESNSSGTKPDNSNTPSNNGNSDSDTSTDSGNEETPSDSETEDSSTNPTENQSQPVDMVGGVVDNPFN